MVWRGLNCAQVLVDAFPRIPCHQDRHAWPGLPKRQGDGTECAAVLAGVVDVAIRLPHGERLLRKFRAGEPVSAVLGYARWKCPGVIGENATVAMQMPRRVLRDMRQSLRDAGGDKPRNSHRRLLGLRVCGSRYAMRAARAGRH